MVLLLLLGGNEAEMSVLEEGGWIGMDGSSEADRVLGVSAFSARFAVRSDNHHSCPREERNGGDRRCRTALS